MDACHPASAQYQRIQASLVSAAKTATTMADSARWQACLDPSSSQIYYVDMQTNSSTWDRPSDFKEELAFNGWQRLWDLEQNLSYWYNSQTGESSWNDPIEQNSDPAVIKPTDAKHGHTPETKTGSAHMQRASRTEAKVPVNPTKDQAAEPLKVNAEADQSAPHSDTGSGNVAAVQTPVQPEQPSPNSFLQQQLKRRNRAHSKAGGAVSPAKGSQASEPVQPARVVRPTQQSVQTVSDSESAAPSVSPQIIASVETVAVASEAIKQRPGTGRKSTEIKISSNFAQDTMLDAEISATAPLAQSHKLRPDQESVHQQTLNPHDRRGLAQRSSSSKESEPPPSKVSIVQAPGPKRRPLPTPIESKDETSSPVSVVNSNPEPDTSKDQRLLEQIVAEIVSSEKSYVQSLQTLVELFIERIVHDPTLTSLLEDARVAMFFSNAEQVGSLNTTFLSDLESVVAADGVLKAPAAIGSLFLRYVKLFSVYTQYARHYSQASEILQSKGELLEPALRDLQRDPRAQGQTIFSLGIMPIQRIPRYCLLLRELQRKLHEPVPEINAALTEVEGTATAINETIRASESRDDMLKAAAASKRGAELLKTGHHLLKTGTLSKIDRNGNQKKYTFMLFADQLRYGNRSISLDGCTIERNPFQLKKKGLHGWVVRTPDRSFMVCAETDDLAAEWIQAIQAECLKFQSSTKVGSLAPVKTNGDFCSVCATRFTMLHRARHCDLCGKPICQNCCVRVRRVNSPKPLRSCHFCRTSDDEEVMDGTVSKSATMTDAGSMCNEDSMIQYDEFAPVASTVASRDPVRNHLAAALEELKLKVAVVEPAPPAPPVVPAASLPAPPPVERRRSTRSALNQLAAKINEVRSRAGSHTDLEHVGKETRVRQDLMADVRTWVQHHRKASNADSTPDDSQHALAGAIQLQPGVASITVQGPIASLDQARSRLIDLESAFLEQLSEVDRVFARPLLDDMTCAALPSSLAIVFDTISNLQTIHNKLLSSLNEGGDLLQALLMFSELARRPYLVYARHYGESIRDLEDASLQGRVNLCAKMAGIQTGAIMVLLKHLARPMQRLPLYISHCERVRELLLQQQQQQKQQQQEPKTETSEELDSDVLSKALANFHQTWKRLSEIVELRASFETLKSIEAQFDAGGSSSVHLAIPSRVFIRWGMLDKYDRRGRCEHLAFHLFSDVLIYSEKVATGFRLRRQIPLQQCQLVRDDEPAKYDHCFQLRLVGSSKSLIIAALSENERRTWIDAINDCIARVLVRKSIRKSKNSANAAITELLHSEAELTFDQSQEPATQGSMNCPETWNEAETWNEPQGFGGGNIGAERYAMFFEEPDTGHTGLPVVVESTDIEKHPREVASLWTLYLTEQGDEYFYNSATGRTTWTRPSEFSVAPQS